MHSPEFFISSLVKSRWNHTHLPFCSVKWSFFPKWSAIKSLQELAARRFWRSFSGFYRRIRVAWVEQKRNVEPQETKGLDPWRVPNFSKPDYDWYLIFLGTSNISGTYFTYQVDHFWFLWFRLGADLAGFLGAAGCHQEFQKRLKNLVEKTRAGKQFGGLCRKLEMP